jgi:hypothetical protein
MAGPPRERGGRREWLEPAKAVDVARNAGKLTRRADATVANCSSDSYNVNMRLKLTDDLRSALLQEPDRLLTLIDEQSKEVYVLVPREQYQRLVDDELRRELQLGFDDIDRGNVGVWDSESIKSQGRAELARRKAQA